ncbi:hypothetical protein [Galbibacter sp. PAP.153]|uniref:hypothetical protein n=1 Tax=Galbibacter sp. PAP.153 TaxID=3104623 RepID=UPI00300A9F02
MKTYFFIAIFLKTLFLTAQIPVSIPENLAENETKFKLQKKEMEVTWPIANKNVAKMILSLEANKPLFRSIGIIENGNLKEIATQLEPRFLINVGKRTLKPENGWTIFFDKVPTRPYTSHVLELNKKEVKVTKSGNRTKITIGEVTAPDFSGNIEITIYNGVPLFNIAAEVATKKDSTAILYDAGLVGAKAWDKIAFMGNGHTFQEIKPSIEDKSINTAVKYRTIIGSSKNGAIAVFPPPHQYFYPLDEAFNLKFTWYGANYREMIPGYGIGIRQDPEGDHRYVPWFNAPPGTEQRLNFFCLLGVDGPDALLDSVKKYTHADTYKSIPSHKTMASHFHNEFIMNVVMKGGPVPQKPEFVDVFKQMGVDIVHLGEFHYTAHPKGPDPKRLLELDALFEQCRRLSDDTFLLLPGEEPNEFLGGHWMALFPKPVYWVMNREDGKPFVSEDETHGKVYRIKDKDEMLRLLELEKGLAWTAHPRIKGSTGYPDAYKEEVFFKSDRFLGGAWKAMPADLSQRRLGLRVLDLMDDMNNWGLRKKVIAESDLFTIAHENEMYAHMNINYLKMDALPNFKNGWQPVLTAMTEGKFFSTTGEILIPLFSVNNSASGQTASGAQKKKATIQMKVDWTFPLHFVEIVTGDGEKTYRERISLDDTRAFGTKNFSFSVDLTGKKWVRVEVWDVAVNGAFTQTVYLE